MVERREPAGIPPSPSATAHPGPRTRPRGTFPGRLRIRVGTFLLLRVKNSSSCKIPEVRQQSRRSRIPRSGLRFFDSPGKLERGMFRGRARQAALRLLGDVTDPLFPGSDEPTGHARSPGRRSQSPRWVSERQLGMAAIPCGKRR